jgi:hypothetical protein
VFVDAEMEATEKVRYNLSFTARISSKWNSKSTTHDSGQ